MIRIMKKVLMTLGVSVISLLCLTSHIYAYVPKEDCNINYTLIEAGSCSLTITGTEAFVSAYVKGNSDVVSADIEITLQEKSGWIWKDIAKWTNHSDSSVVFENEQFTVEKNKTYRLSAKMTVKSKSQTESTTIKSDEKKAK